VTPTYYEVALKIKYIRDSNDIALKIVDMIHDGATTVFACIYNYALENAELVIRTLMTAKTADLASHYAANGSMLEKKFAELSRSNKLFT